MCSFDVCRSSHLISQHVHRNYFHNWKNLTVLIVVLFHQCTHMLMVSNTFVKMSLKDHQHGRYSPNIQR